MSLARFVHLRCVTRVCNEGVPRGVCNEGCVTSQLVLLQRSVMRSVTNVRRGSVTDPSKKFTAMCEHTFHESREVAPSCGMSFQYTSTASCSFSSKPQQAHHGFHGQWGAILGSFHVRVSQRAAKRVYQFDSMINQSVSKVLLPSCSLKKNPFLFRSPRIF